jgi:hypothetical protein
MNEHAGAHEVRLRAAPLIRFRGLMTSMQIELIIGMGTSCSDNRSPDVPERAFQGIPTEWQKFTPEHPV